MLDDYLANRLDEQQKSAFEQKLNSDSALRNEYQVQQQLITSIKKMRAAELKAMMSNIPVPSGASTGTTIGTKIALWTGVAAIIATGVYFYLSDEQTEHLPADTTVPQTEEPVPSVTGEQITEKDEEPSESSQEPASTEQKPSGTPKAIKKDSHAAPVASDPKIEVFDPSDEADPVSSESEELAKNDVKVKEAPSIDVEIDSHNKKYNFHYQFREGRLLLYGPFEKNLYEILEFFNDNKRTIFLFYKDQYYHLNEDNGKLKPLSPITDQVLIKKLREYRNN